MRRLVGMAVVISIAFVVALLAIDAVAEDSVVTTERGATVRRWLFDARLLARLDDLVSGDVRVLPDGAGHPLLPALAQRISSPQGRPLIRLPATGRS